MLADQNTWANPLLEHRHVLEAFVQQLHKFRLCHLAQMVRIVPISSREQWVWCGNDQLAPRSQQARHTADGLQLRRMVDMLNHFKTGHQIKGTRRQTTPQIGALHKTQFGVAVGLPGPLNCAVGNVHAHHRFSNFPEQGGAIARATAEIKHSRALSHVGRQTVTRKVLVFCELPVRIWNVALMHEFFEFAATGLGDDAKEVAPLVID